ncbi:MAG TPA: hypothetical protein DCO75_02330 [Fibrobacteres bacterium]|jgi:hypothetical protein|nr:hypothetical protein [Fibrobacterota bacterium]
MRAFQKKNMPVLIHRLCRRFASLLFLLILSLCFTKINAVTADYTVIKNSLMEKLDSIDVEKQIRKRKGLPIIDLEKQSTTLKDSITELRTVIEKPDNLTAGLNNADSTSIMFKLQTYKKYLPHNAFDWAVLSVGFAAAIAGIILFIVFFSMILKKINMKKKSRPKALNNIDIHTEVGKNISPEINDGQKFTGNDVTGIDSLRKIINEERDFYVMDTGAPAIEKTSAMPESSETDELKKNILAASKDGAGISDLSKKFHVSSDQVSLILRMAQREYGKK